MTRYKAIAAYYDAENARHEMLRHDVPFFLEQLPARRQDVLEVAAGTGRAAIAIAQAGHRVVGVDYADDMLAIARRKRDAARLTEKQLPLVCQDALKLNVERKFDWACVFFNTLLAFTTIEEQDQLLQAIRRHLKRRGRLWVDLFNPDLEMLSRAAETGLEPGAFYVPELGRTVYRTTDVRRDMAEQVMRVTFNYQWFDARGRPKRERFAFDMTCIFPRELRLLMERNGFRVERVYGNYDGTNFVDESPRMIANCVVR